MNNLTPRQKDNMRALLRFVHRIKIKSVDLLPEFGEIKTVRLGYKHFYRNGVYRSQTRDYSLTTFKLCGLYIEEMDGDNVLRLTAAGIQFMEEGGE